MNTFWYIVLALVAAVLVVALYMIGQVDATVSQAPQSTGERIAGAVTGWALNQLGIAKYA